MNYFTFKGQFLFVVFMLLGCTSLFAADKESSTTQVVVTLDHAGTLADKIGENQKHNITSLKVVGEINGDDVALLRDMAGCDRYLFYTDGVLATLDLSEAKIVEGGGAYFERYDMAMSDIQYTKNDEIGESFFFNCSSLKSVSLPTTVKKIDFCAFAVCSNLESVTIPEGVTSIGACAFEFSENIKTMKLPSTVTEIGNRAFYNCKGLESINIPDDVKELGYCCFADCTSLTDFYLPSGITTLGRYALSNCSALKSIRIPSSVTTVEDLAFLSCTGLEAVYVGWATPLAINTDAFNKVDKDACKLYVPYGTLSAYKASTWGECFTDIEEYDVTGVGKLPAATDVNVVSRYAADGYLLTAPVKGLNIVKYSDGSVRKVVVR